MKKLFLIVLILIFGSPAFADNGVNDKWVVLSHEKIRI